MLFESSVVFSVTLCRDSRTFALQSSQIILFIFLKGFMTFFLQHLQFLLLQPKFGAFHFVLFQSRFQRYLTGDMLFGCDRPVA